MDTYVSSHYYVLRYCSICDTVKMWLLCQVVTENIGFYTCYITERSVNAQTYLIVSENKRKPQCVELETSLLYSEFHFSLSFVFSHLVFLPLLCSHLDSSLLPSQTFQAICVPLVLLCSILDWTFTILSIIFCSAGHFVSPISFFSIFLSPLLLEHVP